jgi:hypothetical protein
MAFMKPVAEYFTAYRVETNHCGELIPEGVCGAIDLDAEPRSEQWTSLLQYCEGTRIEGVEREEGWYGRLSAAGYLDCTSWDGPYATADEALAAVRGEYDCDENGDEPTEDAQ